jgi:hypothetical protein
LLSSATALYSYSRTVPQKSWFGWYAKPFQEYTGRETWRPEVGTHSGTR